MVEARGVVGKIHQGKLWDYEGNYA